MSWLFSRALVAEYSAANCSDGELSAQLSVMPTQHKFWRNDKTMEFCDLSRFGLTLNLLTESRGGELLTLFLAGFPARTLAPLDLPQGLREREAAYGGKWYGSFARYNLEESLWKTPQCSLLEDSETFLETWPRWGLMRNGECFLAEPREPQLKENEFSLPAPTKSMGKRGWGISNVKARYSEKIETNARIFGYKPHPSILEWSMGWIPTWTKLQPLETGKFQSWLQQHGEPLEAR